MYRVARTLDARLRGTTVRTADLRVPRHATADLTGARVLGTVPRGKHLLTRFDLDGSALTLHTHLRMDGSWTVLAPGKVLPRRLDPDVRVLLRTTGPTAAGLKLGVVELLPTAEEAGVVGHLGPDLLDTGTPLDELVAQAVRNLAREPGRPLAAALLDQRVLAGLGNLWVNELCHLRGHLPTTPVGQVALEPLVRMAVRMLRFSISPGGAHQVTTGDTRPGRRHWVYGRAGQPCLRCGTPVRVAAEVPGDAERRRTWWCPNCQR